MKGLIRKVFIAVFMRVGAAGSSGTFFDRPSIHFLISMGFGYELSCDLIDKVVVRHVLPILHDADNASLRLICQIPPYKGRALHLCLVPSFPINPVVHLLLFFSASTFDKTILIQRF
jgi:hypothetical protein